MAWEPISDADVPGDEESLDSAFGNVLYDNIDALRSTRLKRHSIAYYLGPTSSSGSTPPSGDSTLVGPVVAVAGSTTNDPEAIGLKLSSPPTEPLAIGLGSWPLSANAEKIRIIVGCATGEADVHLVAVAIINGAAVPAAPMQNLIRDDEGVVTFNTTITGSDAYKAVGTSSPSASQDVKPVVLEIDLGGKTGTDFGFHGDDDEELSCRLYLCVLSTEGSAISYGTSSAQYERGRRIDTSLSFTGLGINPGPYHAWLRVVPDDDVGATDAYGPLVRGILQVRPDDVTDPASSNSAMFVVHPPFDGRGENNNISFGTVAASWIRVDGISVSEREA